MLNITTHQTFAVALSASAKKATRKSVSGVYARRRWRSPSGPVNSTSRNPCLFSASRIPLSPALPVLALPFSFSPPHHRRLPCSRHTQSAAPELDYVDRFRCRLPVNTGQDGTEFTRVRPGLYEKPSSCDAKHSGRRVVHCMRANRPYNKLPTVCRGRQLLYQILLRVAHHCLILDAEAAPVAVLATLLESVRSTLTELKIGPGRSAKSDSYVPDALGDISEPSVSTLCRGACSRLRRKRVARRGRCRRSRRALCALCVSTHKQRNQQAPI